MPCVDGAGVAFEGLAPLALRFEAGVGDVAVHASSIVGMPEPLFGMSRAGGGRIEGKLSCFNCPLAKILIGRGVQAREAYAVGREEAEVAFTAGF